ncbi:unnamed protein product [Brugia timori]|uniref:Secreted protein n=1 Tax=Brugia timori TaxID=42155 RepID=A0A0R3QD83_9BILA|nr:unnamed protein product [Brugia timori]
MFISLRSLTLLPVLSSLLAPPNNKHRIPRLISSWP